MRCRLLKAVIVGKTRVMKEVSVGCAVLHATNQIAQCDKVVYHCTSYPSLYTVNNWKLAPRGVVIKSSFSLLFVFFFFYSLSFFKKKFVF